MGRIAATIAVTTLALTVGVAPAPATVACADGFEGSWAGYGRDLSNSRFQPDGAPTVAEAATLAPSWTFSSIAAGGDGDFTGTPVVADGCVYVGSNTGWVFALNADSGELVWKTLLDAPQLGFLAGGGIPGSLAVANGIVYVNTSRNPNPFLAALDQQTGDVLWETVVAERAGAALYSSPVVFDDMVIVGVSAPSGGESGRIAFVDAHSGAQITETFTIPPHLWEQGFQGAGVWSTAAVDPVAKLAYVGTGEPDAGGGAVEAHPHANAVLKIDVDRASETFGEIVGHFNGDESAIDFGASPVLFAGDEGATLVGDLQRNGRFYAIDTATMTESWSADLGPQGAHRALGDAGSPATDGTSVFATANPGLVFGLGADDGARRWVSPTLDAARYQPVSVAGEVVYTVDAKGFLLAFDAATGAPLAARPLAGPATGIDPTVSLGSGVSVAGGTVFVSVGTSLWENGFVVALRPL